MGWYPGGTPSEAELERMRHQFYENTGSVPPEFFQQLPAVAAELGIPVEDLDGEAALGALFTGFENLAEFAASKVGITGLRRAFEIYYQNPTRNDGLWEALFGFGPKGVAVALFVNDAFTDGVMVGAAASMLRESGAPYRLSEQGNAVQALPVVLSVDQQRLHDALVEAGFASLPDSLYKGTYLGAGDRTQMIWILLAQPELLLMSPIATIADDELPAITRGQDFGRYSVEKYSPFAVIQIALPVTISYDMLHAEAATLATYADQWESVIAPGADDL